MSAGNSGVSSDLKCVVRCVQISCVFAQQGRKRPEDYRAQGAPPRETLSHSHARWTLPAHI